MANKKTNPFKALRLTNENPKGEVVFELATGVWVRATYNLSTSVGRLSRGTIGIWDPATKRYKQRIRDGTHNFSNAMTMELIIPAPKDDETQTEIIERTTRQAADKLLNKFRPQILTAIHDDKDLENHSLGQALEIYGADYIADRSTSAEMRKMYHNQLHRLANFLGERPLKTLKRKDLVQFCCLHKGENSIDYIFNFQKFLSDTAFKIGVVPPCKDVLEAFLRNTKTKKETRNTDRSIVSDLLPRKYEDKLDKGCWDHLGDPYWGITVMGKEGGLDVKRLCNIKIKDIVLGDTAEEVYVILKRDDLASYTNDYSFALSPYGASYISEYLAYLKESFPPERTAADKFLFSNDGTGENPLTTTEVNSFIRKDLSRFLFGSVGRVPLNSSTTISMSLDLLRNTRKKHLLEDIRFDGDDSAIQFLLHRSLTRSVQADNYRCFTDIYGRQLLRKRLAQDRHGCRPSPPQKYTRMSNRVSGNNRELHFPPKRNTCPGCDQLITVTITGLKPGDMIEILGNDGCYAWFD